MSKLTELRIGDRLPAADHGPITTRQLVQYAGASLDFNRIHYDDPFARAGGHPSVIVHGMLSMAFFGQLVAEIAGPEHVRALKARFRAVAYPGDVIRVGGEVVDVRLENQQTIVELKLTATRPDGTVTLEGSATLT
jgi:peroxisomal enoyl-CoA hydratase 2